MKYYLGPWQWLTAPMPCFSRPAGTLGAIDLGTLPQMEMSGADRGGCLCWTAGAALPSEYTPMGDGDCREILPGAAVKAAFQSLIGYRPQGNTLAECIYDCLVGGADSDGQSGPMPIVPTIDGWMDLWMPGHSRVLSERFEWGRPGSRGSNHTAKIKKILRKQFSEVMQLAQAGKLKDTQHHRRVLDAWCDKYGLQGAEDWREFVPANLQADVPGRLKHETTITENFNTADSDTLGPTLTWTEVSGDFDIVSNLARKISSAATVNFSRAESSLSSSDHYSQCKVYSSGALAGSGPAIRFAAGAATCYITFSYASQQYLTKFVTGTQTNLTNSADTFMSGDTYKIDANGSTLTGYKNGSQQVTTTDSSISGNVLTGLDGFENNTEFDDFEAADLAAAPSILYTQLENWPRGVERGVYTRQGG